MRNIILTVEYDGSRYHGFENLGSDSFSGTTVAGKLKEVIKKMTQEDDVELICGFRTEVGVHAYAQVVNFLTSSSLPTEDIRHYMNKYLPMDIAIVEANEAPQRFHAKLNAKSKTFLFHIFINKEPGVFERKHSAYSLLPINRKRLGDAATLFVGKHDFKHFSNSKSNKSTIKEILDINVYGDDDENEIFITISANDFLYNMAATIIGTLIEIGSGVRPLSDIPLIFKGEKKASPPCDPKGLFLQKIEY